MEADYKNQFLVGLEKSCLPYLKHPDILGREGNEGNYYFVDWELVPRLVEGELRGELTLKKENSRADAHSIEYIDEIAEQLSQKDPQNWYWTKEPVPIFTGASSFYIAKDILQSLEDCGLPKKNHFPEIIVCNELYDREVMIGFGTARDIESAVARWYDTLIVSADNLLRQYLQHGELEGNIKKITSHLDSISLGLTPQLQLEARLRKLLANHPSGMNVDEARNEFQSSPIYLDSFDNRICCHRALQEAMENLKDSLLK